MSTPIVSTTRILNPAPKTRFLESAQNISSHRQMVDSREFVRGADFALLQYQRSLLAKETNPTIVGMKMAGAQEFLAEFLLLSEEVKMKPVTPVSDNLQAQ